MTDPTPTRHGPVTVELCPDGPVLVRGADAVLDGDGNAVPVTRPVVAVCTCGMSQRRPWCDGTHKVRLGRCRRAGPGE